MPSLAAQLATAEEALKPVSGSARADAEILLAHALKVPRKKLAAMFREKRKAPGFDALIQRRLAYEPVPYILGEWEFFSMALAVEPPILVPRPETEHLVEVVLEYVGSSPMRILDLGTGSGCVALAVAFNAPQCRVLATDISETALALARRNAERHGLTARVTFAVGDLFGAVSQTSSSAVPEGTNPVQLNADEDVCDTNKFDAVCSNPPYVEESAWPGLSPTIRGYEDPRALLAGKDGLDVIRRMVREAPAHLRPGGLLAFEIGMGQYDAVAALLHEQCYEAVGVRNDLAGIPRIVFGRRPRS